jgi:hypothetical protein
MHIVLLASDGLSPTEIARVLFSSSRTTVYAVAARFVREKRAAFLDRRRRGPTPSLEEAINDRIERLVGEGSPASHEWLRSPASLELQTPRLRVAQGASRRGEPRDHSPRAPSPGLPLEKAAPRLARERLREANGAKARQTRRCPANGQKSGIVLSGRDEARDQLQGRLLLDAQRQTQKPLPTPGTNRKTWISVALNFHTGCLHWVWA